MKPMPVSCMQRSTLCGLKLTTAPSACRQCLAGIVFGAQLGWTSNQPHSAAPSCSRPLLPFCTTISLAGRSASGR